MRLTPNEKTVTLKLTRAEVIKLMLASSMVGCAAVTGSKEWDGWAKIHDKLTEQLEEHDAKEAEI